MLNNTIEDSLSKLSESHEKIITDNPVEGLSYVGFSSFGASESDPVWKIFKIEDVGTVTTYEWATGYKNNTNIWDDRASLSYF